MKILTATNLFVLATFALEARAQPTSTIDGEAWLFETVEIDFENLLDDCTRRNLQPASNDERQLGGGSTKFVDLSDKEKLRLEDALLDYFEETEECDNKNEFDTASVTFLELELTQDCADEDDGRGDRQLALPRRLRRQKSKGRFNRARRANNRWGGRDKRMELIRRVLGGKGCEADLVKSLKERGFDTVTDAKVEKITQKDCDKQRACSGSDGDYSCCGVKGCACRDVSESLCDEFGCDIAKKCRKYDDVCRESESESDDDDDCPKRKADCNRARKCMKDKKCCKKGSKREEDCIDECNDKCDSSSEEDDDCPKRKADCNKARKCMEDKKCCKKGSRREEDCIDDCNDKCDSSSEEDCKGGDCKKARKCIKDKHCCKKSGKAEKKCKDRCNDKCETDPSSEDECPDYSKADCGNAKYCFKRKGCCNKGCYNYCNYEYCYHPSSHSSE